MARKTPEAKPAEAAKPARKAPSRRSKAPAAPATAAHRAPLLVTVSGIRGIVGDSFTALSVAPYLDAFARLIKGTRVIVGHDARPSAKWILPLIEGILRSRGIDVAFVGLCPTPTVGLLVRKMKAAGGIVVTASHNPIEYNGLKFFSSAGEFITPDMVAELKVLAATPAAETSNRIGKKAILTDAAEIHLQTLLGVFPPPEKVRASKRIKVIIDCCNSTGVEIAPDVADAYGALIQMMYADKNAHSFPRGAEPVEENLTALRRAVVREEADIGFAIDPDGDRLALVDETGKAIGEERTLLLATDAYLNLMKKPTPIVVNLSTSRAIEDLAKRHGVPVYRTAIGEANVLAGMRLHKARIGGEGNGGVIVPAVQPGRDAATAIALILLGMQARGNSSLSEWNASFPTYVMVKHKIELREGLNGPQALERVKKAFAKEKIDTTDGVKVIFEDRWVHVRTSNTEPIIRVFSEAPTTEAATELVDRAVKAVQ